MRKLYIFKTFIIHEKDLKQMTGELDRTAMRKASVLEIVFLAQWKFKHKVSVACRNTHLEWLWNSPLFCHGRFVCVYVCLCSWRTSRNACICLLEFKSLTGILDFLWSNNCSSHQICLRLPFLWPTTTSPNAHLVTVPLWRQDCQDALSSLWQQVHKCNITGH